MDGFRKALAGFGDLKDGWDGDDAPAPTEKVIYKADQFLLYLSEQYPNLMPSRIGPSVDGSIVVAFLMSGVRTNVEFFEEETLAMIAKDGQPMEIWEVKEEKDIDYTIDKIIEALKQIKK